MKIFKKISAICVLKRNCEKFMEKYVSVPEPLFNMLHAGFQPAAFLRKSLLHRHFPVATLHMFIVSGFAGTQNYLLTFLIKFIEKKLYFEFCAKMFYL